MSAKLKVIMNIEETNTGHIRIIERVEISGRVSEKFKQQLYDDFGIDLDDEFIKKVTKSTF